MALLDELYGAPASGLNADLYGSPKPVEKSKPMGYGEMVGQAMMNIPSSAGNLMSGLYHAATNPVQTASGIMDVAAGGLKNAMPQSVVDFVNKFETNPEAAQRAVMAANEAGGALKQRYGSIEGI